MNKLFADKNFKNIKISSILLTGLILVSSTQINCMNPKKISSFLEKTPLFLAITGFSIGSVQFVRHSIKNQEVNNSPKFFDFSDPKKMKKLENLMVAGSN